MPEALGPSVNMPWPLPSIAAWWLGRPPAFRILLLAATAIFLVELSLRRFAPGSRLYASWKRTFTVFGIIAHNEPGIIVSQVKSPPR